jgi:hypothetical protein
MTVTNPTLTHPISASIATLPAYYPLYALYVDYQINNVHHARVEDLERVREALRVIAPLIGKEQPYRMEWSLRLFTERQALAGYAPELVDEAWRQVREAIERLGPPPGWRSVREQLRHRVTQPQLPTAPAPPARPPGPEAFFPKSPIDYRRAV